MYFLTKRLNTVTSITFSCTFNECIVDFQTFLHKANVWLDELLKKHHIRKVSVWREMEEGQKCSKRLTDQEPSNLCDFSD